LSSTQYAQGGWEFGGVRILPGGGVEVLTGASSQGQGHDTVFTQIAADVLGVEPAAVRVLHGDTAVVPMGTGTFSSRSVIVGGPAVIRAAHKVLAKARRVAAHLLEAAEEDLAYDQGSFSVVGAPGRSVSLADVARAAYVAWDLPPDTEPGLLEHVVFDPTDWTYPFGAHVAVVEVDRDTGAVRLRDYVAVDDCGVRISPMLVRGQVHGGLAQGIAQALWEELVYAGDGQLATGTLMDYALPRADDLPAFRDEATVTPTPFNPLGAKGIGEAATIGSTPAVVNAVVDALRPFGVRHLDMPLRPASLPLPR
jgi:carbon-monoxide dehydrogenase large subunit